MSESKKYYYMKLKDNFYNTDDIKLLEGMPNGYEYSSFYLKLCLMSLKEEGRLVFKGRIPYKPEMLSTITGHNIDIIRSAIKILEQMEMINILDTGTIFINDIQTLVGNSNSEADRKRKYREKIKKEESLLLPENTHKKTIEKDTMGHSSGHRPPEIEIEIEIKDRVKEKDKEKKDFSFSDEDTNISKTPLRKKRQPSQPSQIKKQDYVQEQKQTFIKQVEEIYPKQFTDKEGFRRLEKFYDTKILSKDSQDKTNNNQTTFIKNLEACLELKQDYMFHLKNYIGTDSKKSKNYHEENFIEKLEASKKSKRPERKKHNALDHYAYSGNAAQEMMEAEEKARKLWEETGEQSPGFIFGL